MGMQKQVNLTVAAGVAGDMATPDQSIYQAVNFLAEEPCAVGSFVFAGTNAENQAKPAGAGKPIGLVQRNQSYINTDVLSPGTLTVPAGSPLTIAVKGDYWVETKTTATVGQKVFANNTDGTISTDTAGGSVGGHTETDWVVKTAGEVGDMIIISAWA